jgi:parvulin-like peptidyl-prolyl isomerase
MKSFLLVILLSGFSITAHAAEQPVNGILAIVNDSIITLGEVSQRVSSQVQLLRLEYGNRPEVLRERVRELHQEAIQEFVERELILHDFKTSGFKLPESYLDNEIEREIQEQYGDRIRMIQDLHARGMTIDSYREQRRQNIIIQIMRSRNVSAQKIMITPYKIQQYYEAHQDDYRVGERVELSMITLLQREYDPPGAARSRAREILRKLEEGVPFSEMAAVYTDGSPASKPQKWERDELRPELADAAFSLQPGERSGIIEIETPEGCFILQLEALHDAHVRPLEEVQDEIEQELRRLEANRLNQQWIETLTEKSFVKYFAL